MGKDHIVAMVGMLNRDLRYLSSTIESVCGTARGGNLRCFMCGKQKTLPDSRGTYDLQVITA